MALIETGFTKRDLQQNTYINRHNQFARFSYLDNVTANIMSANVRVEIAAPSTPITTRVSPTTSNLFNVVLDAGRPRLAYLGTSSLVVKIALDLVGTRSAGTGRITYIYIRDVVNLVDIARCGGYDQNLSEQMPLHAEKWGTLSPGAVLNFEIVNIVNNDDQVVRDLSVLIEVAESAEFLDQDTALGSNIYLNDLSDCTISAPVLNQVLTYNGLGQWVNQNPGGGGGAIVKAGTVALPEANQSFRPRLSGSVTFNTSFSTAPIVTMTMKSLASELTSSFVTRNVTTTGFDFESKLITNGSKNFIIDNTASITQQTSIKKDSLGFPTIAYYDSTAQDLKFARCSTQDGLGTWTIVTIAGNSPSTAAGQYCSLCYDVNGFPIVAFQDGNQVMFARCTTTNGLTVPWTKQAPWPGGSGNNGMYNTLLLDTAGFPILSFYDVTNGDLKFARSTTQDGLVGWGVATVDSVNNTGTYAFMRLNPAGFPCIAYITATFPYLIKYAVNSAPTGLGTWTISTVTSSASLPMFSSLGFLSSGFPFIPYYSQSLDFFVVIGNSTSGGTWTSYLITQGNNVGNWTWPVLEPVTNKPIISFHHAANGTLSIARNTQVNGLGTWELITVDSGGVGSGSSIEFDVSNNIMISYIDVNNTALKFTRPVAETVEANWIATQPSNP